MNFFRRRTTLGRRPARKRRNRHLLEVTATAETTRRRRNQKILLYAGEAIVAAGLLAFAWLGIQALLNSQVFTNPKYGVRVVEVDTGGVMTREEALSRTGIKEGLNIFSLNLESAQRVLSSIPEVKDARIERILPDTVTIKIEGRRPVAWVAPRDTGAAPETMDVACVVDASGVMMKPEGFASGLSRLPVVYGVPTEQWRPGDTIEMRELRAALELLKLASERANPEVVLRAADISKGWCIEAWGDPQTRYRFGLRDLPVQLTRLQFLMLHVAQTSRKIATANLIPERNTPVTFQGDPPPSAPVPEVVRKATKP